MVVQAQFRRGGVPSAARLMVTTATGHRVLGDPGDSRDPGGTRWKGDPVNTVISPAQYKDAPSLLLCGCGYCRRSDCAGHRWRQSDDRVPRWHIHSASQYDVHLCADVSSWHILLYELLCGGMPTGHYTDEQHGVRCRNGHTSSSAVGLLHCSAYGPWRDHPGLLSSCVRQSCSAFFGPDPFSVYTSCGAVQVCRADDPSYSIGDAHKVC